MGSYRIRGGSCSGKKRLRLLRPLFPKQRFFQLRQQVALLIAKYDGQPWIGNPEAKPPENEWLEERRKAYDHLGSELVAFADSNTFLARALHHKVLGPYRCYVRNAGTSLRTLGAAYPGTQAWDASRGSVLGTLKIAGWPSD